MVGGGARAWKALARQQEIQRARSILEQIHRCKIPIMEWLNFAPSQILKMAPLVLRRERNDGFLEADLVRPCWRGLRVDSAGRCTVRVSLPFCGFAQTAKQGVYGSASATTTTSILTACNKDSTTGALPLLPGAPFLDRQEGGLIAIDGQGKFLFVPNPVSNHISMFQIEGVSCVQRQDAEEAAEEQVA